MATMKKTLLEIVDDILNDLDSDTITTIGDTVESTQVANIVAQTYFDLISDRVIPEHFELFRLTALVDATRPNYMALPDEVAKVVKIEYNKSQTGEQEYREIYWREPMDFIRDTSTRDSSSATVDTVPDFNSSTELLIDNSKMPNFWTSFDNKHVVMDSYDSAIDTQWLVAAKSRGFGQLIPTVTISDSFTFDFESKYFPYLIAEAKSRSFSILHKTLDQKVEQVARRHKSYIQKEKHRIETPNKRATYGRT
jgi:hypothetical protein